MTDISNFEATTQSDVSVSASGGIYEKFGKRVVDLVLSLMLAPLIVPVIAVLWFIVRRDGSAGFFMQDRVGKDGKVFSCMKLRTMVPNAEKVLEDMIASDPKVAHEWHVNQKLERDPRITKIGRLLRATSLDELPQFFNVVRGDMSFVGPRPFLPSQEQLYVDAGGEGYYRVRPGITGPWQVDGRGITTFCDRVAYDETYVDSLSLKADASFIYKTVGVVLKRTGH